MMATEIRDLIETVLREQQGRGWRFPRIEAIAHVGDKSLAVLFGDHTEATITVTIRRAQDSTEGENDG